MWGGNYRGLEYRTESGTYYTTAAGSAGLTDTTALTRSSTSGESYLTRSSTSATNYLTKLVNSKSAHRYTRSYYDNRTDGSTRFCTNIYYQSYVWPLTAIATYYNNTYASIRISYSTTYFSSRSYDYEYDYSYEVSGYSRSYYSSYSYRTTNVGVITSTSSSFTTSQYNYTEKYYSTRLSDYQSYGYEVAWYGESTKIRTTSALCPNNVLLVFTSSYWGGQSWRYSATTSVSFFISGDVQTTSTQYLTRSSTSGTSYLTRSSTSGYSGKSSSSTSGWY